MHVADDPALDADGAGPGALQAKADAITRFDASPHHTFVVDAATEWSRLEAIIPVLGARGGSGYALYSATKGAIPARVGLAARALVTPSASRGAATGLLLRP